MREEYPRPNFVREEWMSLNGSWDFSAGDRKWKIQVPFVCQSALSGIGEKIKEDLVLYRRPFQVPGAWKGRRVLLHFGAVDYECRVWVNGHLAGFHAGGQTPFHMDVTDLLNWEMEDVQVEVHDWLKDETIARGKQFWEETPRFIWYTPSTGIWQSVWLEPAGETRLEWVHFTPDIDEGMVRIDYRLARGSVLPCQVEIEIDREGEAAGVFQGSMTCGRLEETIAVDVFGKKALNGAFHFTGAYWSPEAPNLYQVKIRLKVGGEVEDQVESYFGMRKIEARNGRIYLNHKPYYQKLVLDQGYWKEGLVTAPGDEAFRQDIIKAKAMGFNGCRKHEKVEDPRFLYWADRLGFLVWESMASFWTYTPQGACAFMREWMEVIQRDYNHPSIIVWGMMNESWGIPRILHDPMQQGFLKSLYYLAHSQDSTRLVVSNDGWEMADTDICAFHSYQQGRKGDEKQQAIFREGLKTLEGLERIVEKPLFAHGSGYQGQPVVLTEFGGISLSGQEGGWGYAAVEKDGFLDEYARILEAISQSRLVCGFCYTQLADVEQEVNGLLTWDHEYKFSPEKLKAIHDEV